MAEIELRNVRKTFKDVVAVRDMNLHIKDGEFVAFLGPSGCGKTTTLRIVSGLEVPDTGRILIDDQDVTDLPPRNRDVAMVFQDYALYPHMSVLDNIGYPLKVRGVGKPEIADEVGSVAANLQIDMLLARRPGQLSGGQQQRVAVARAVVHQAKVFLFDEPLSNLDAKLRLEARAFLKHLQHEVGITSIYVTHDQAEAMALANRIVVMRSGDVMQVGTPLEIYRQPANIFVASFIGNPPMNLLPCRFDNGRIHLQVHDAGLSIDVPDAHLPQQIQRGAPMTLGIRPEHISIFADPTPNTIPARLYVTQTLGGEALIIAYIGEQLISIRIFEDEAPTLPEQIYLQFDPERLFFYDAEENLIQ
jgi:ABC-type sugar transport system ATPase subunit